MSLIEHKYKLKNLSSWLHYSFRSCFFIFFISDKDGEIFLTSKGKNLEKKVSNLNHFITYILREL